jgi:predicted SnoaL-like aldol condensation-catalyzing enzyme
MDPCEERLMRRSLLLAVAGAVLFSTAIALIAASLFLQTPSVAGSSTGDATSATVVRQFYAAVNAAIATGDMSAVHHVVAPHFVEHNRLPGQRPGREGLEDTLAALHARNPDMQVVADTVVADDKQVLARVAVVGIAGAASSSGTVIGPSTPWGPVDVFRVTGGKIVERWSHTDGVAMVLPLANASIELSTPSPRVMTLERLHIAPGDHWTSLTLGPRLLYLEAGALQVNVGSPLLYDGPLNPAPERGPAVVRETATAPQVVPLSVGQSLVVPSSAQVETTNVGAGVVQVLVVTFEVPRIPGGAQVGPESLPPGVVRQTLAGGMATDVPIGSATLVLEQVTLTRNAWVSLPGATRPSLLAVESGRLGVEARGQVWMRRGRDGMSAHIDEARLEVGDGLQLHPGSLALLHGQDGEPAVALVLTLRPRRASVPTIPMP